MIDVKELRRMKKLHEDSVKRYALLAVISDAPYAKQMKLLGDPALDIFSQLEYDEMWKEVNIALVDVAKKWVKRLCDDVGITDV